MFNSVSLFRFPSLFNDPIFYELRPSASYLDDVDVFEDDSTISLKLDVPGMKREDLKVELREGLLIIKGRREEVTDGLRHKGRRSLELSRSFTNDESLDQDRIEATCSDGVLSIVQPKRQRLVRQIEIK